MCEVCRMSPCHPRCPNAPEPKPVYTCKNCKEGILPGDTFVIIDGDYFCAYCLDDMLPFEILQLCGFDVEVAREDDEQW